jgi:hypothetical protein
MVLFPLATSVPAGTDSDFCRVNSKQSQMIYTDTTLGEGVICIANTNIIILLNELIRYNLYYFLIYF